MTAAAALKMTTPSAVDTEVICYIIIKSTLYQITKDKWKRTKRIGGDRGIIRLKHRYPVYNSTPES
jgi:hypothetical protein